MGQIRQTSPTANLTLHSPFGPHNRTATVLILRCVLAARHTNAVVQGRVAASASLAQTTNTPAAPTKCLEAAAPIPTNRAPP